MDENHLQDPDILEEAGRHLRGGVFLRPPTSPPPPPVAPCLARSSLSDPGLTDCSVAVPASQLESHLCLYVLRHLSLGGVAAPLLAKTSG